MDKRDYKAMNEKPTGYISGKPNKALCLWGHEPIDRKLLALEIYYDLIELRYDEMLNGKKESFYSGAYNDCKRIVHELFLLDEIIDLYKEPTERYRFTANGCLIRDGVQII